MLDTRFLQAQIYVATIAEERSFQRAARRLRTSPAVLTKRVADIERMLDVRIFDRSTRPLELTPTGGKLISEVNASILHAERAYDLAQYWSQQEKGPIRIGYSTFSNILQMQRLFKIDLSRYEAQQIVNDGKHMPVMQLESGYTPMLIERIMRGQLHAALGVAPVLDKDIWCEPISREPICICICKGHRLDRHGAYVPLRELDGETILGPLRHIHPALYDQQKEHFERIGVRSFYQEVPSYVHAMELVASGTGLALLPKSVSKITRPGITYRLIADSFPMIETVFLAHRDTMRNEATKDLILFLAAELKGK